MAIDWPGAIRVGLLAFWALWLTLVVVTNIFDGLKAAGALPGSWRFASGNYDAMREVTARYDTPGWIVGLLFAGAVLWEIAAMVLMWRALLAWGAVDPAPVYLAFAVSLGLWAAFILADEVFSAYEMSRSHWLIFGAQLLSLLAIVLLPA